MTKTEKLAKREANKRPTHKDKAPAWISVWDSARGPARRLTKRSYQLEKERRNT